MIITEQQLAELHGLVAEINRDAGDQIILVGVSQEGLHFESQNSDLYCADVTEVAFDFIDPDLHLTGISSLILIARRLIRALDCC